MRWLCFLLGHDDPVMLGNGFIPPEILYSNWKGWDRDCTRCGKPLKPHAKA